MKKITENKHDDVKCDLNCKKNGEYFRQIQYDCKFRAQGQLPESLMEPKGDYVFEVRTLSWLLYPSIL